MNNLIERNTELALELFRQMKRIRLTEEAIVQKYSENKMRCPVHLCIGQEAISAAVGVLLRKTDFVLSTHRCHGHYLAKGGNLKKMIAEIYGKATGCSKGKGGSMHLIDKSVGFMGSTAIVGGTIPIAVGLGLSVKLHKTDQVGCVFLGDGAIEEGVFYESVNFAALKRLPVLFICENNLYSVYSHLNVRQPKNRKIHEMVSGMGCLVGYGDGNNALEVYDKLKPAIELIRQGKGPYFFEFATYRWREHCGPNYDNDIGYRSEEEFLEWKKKDPVELLEKMLLKKTAVSEKDIYNISQNIQNEIEEAFEYAENSPFPERLDIFKHLYSESVQ
jgi:TPP-dependent pyruvate/acetoin dehydrogenase alpha subunit